MVLGWILMAISTGSIQHLPRPTSPVAVLSTLTAISLLKTFDSTITARFYYPKRLICRKPSSFSLSLTKPSTILIAFFPLTQTPLSICIDTPLNVEKVFPGPRRLPSNSAVGQWNIFGAWAGDMLCFSRSCVVLKRFDFGGHSGHKNQDLRGASCVCSFGMPVVGASRVSIPAGDIPDPAER